MTDTAVTWDEIVEHCSRLHTTSQRPVGPWADAELREDSKVMKVTIRERPAQIVPTRMHEPGFYVWFTDEALPARTDVATVELQAAAGDGEVRRAEG